MLGGGIRSGVGSGIGVGIGVGVTGGGGRGGGGDGAEGGGAGLQILPVRLLYCCVQTESLQRERPLSILDCFVVLKFFLCACLKGILTA